MSVAPRVILVTKAEQRITGLSRYVDSLASGLHQISEVEVSVVSPRPLPILKPAMRILGRLGLDLETFLNAYPLRLGQRFSDVQTIYHLTSQNLATILAFQCGGFYRQLKPSVVTVHDIIPYLVRANSDLDTQRHVADRFFFQLSLNGLRNAEAIIAISHYTRQTLIDVLGYPAERIHVIYRAVDTQRFIQMTGERQRIPLAPRAQANQFGLDPDMRYILYVGSDDPRKNLPTLIRAFAEIQGDFPDVRLIKAGTSHFPAERKKLDELVRSLGLQDKVYFIEKLPDDDLPALYSTAEIFVLPSYYEGFGLPALEAMACGTPVIAANATSLPEVVGEAGLLFDPGDVKALVICLARLLKDADLQNRLAEAGRERALRFTLQRQAQQTLDVYYKILGVNSARGDPVH